MLINILKSFPLQFIHSHTVLSKYDFFLAEKIQVTVSYIASTGYHYCTRGKNYFTPTNFQNVCKLLDLHLVTIE